MSKQEARSDELLIGVRPADATVVTMPIEISRLTKATPEVVEQINALIPQLKPEWDPVTVTGLAHLIESPTRLYVACSDRIIVGMTLLVPHRHLPGLRFHVEDVVVDSAHRRCGVARSLLTAAMADTPDDVLSFDLRSHRKRRAAHALYVGLGFEPSETTVFRRPLPSSSNRAANRRISAAMCDVSDESADDGCDE